MNTVKYIKEILGVLAILTTFTVWAINYHDKFVTVEDAEAYKEKIQNGETLSKLDTNISIATILVTIYELHGLEKLNAKDRAVYDRENARLINLQAQRDKRTGHEGG